MGPTLTGLSGALRGVSRIGLDTTPIIYYIEANPVYDRLVSQVFVLIDSGALSAYTSTISLLEVLVQPYKQGNQSLALRYQNLLLDSANITVLDLDARTADEAARIRATYGLRAPDAVQVATAIVSGCDAMLTNDHRIKSVSEIKILALIYLTN